MRLNKYRLVIIGILLFFTLFFAAKSIINSQYEKSIEALPGNVQDLEVFYFQKGRELDVSDSFYIFLKEILKPSGIEERKQRGEPVDVNLRINMTLSSGVELRIGIFIDKTSGLIYSTSQFGKVGVFTNTVHAKDDFIEGFLLSVGL